MIPCPFCDKPIAETELPTSACPKCGSPLPSNWIQQRVAAPSANLGNSTGSLTEPDAPLATMINTPDGTNSALPSASSSDMSTLDSTISSANPTPRIAPRQKTIVDASQPTIELDTKTKSDSSVKLPQPPGILTLDDASQMTLDQTPTTQPPPKKIVQKTIGDFGAATVDFSTLAPSPLDDDTIPPVAAHTAEDDSFEIEIREDLDAEGGGSSELSIDERIATVWQGQMGSEVNNSTSLRVGGRSVDTSTHILIQPRHVGRERRVDNPNTDYEIMELLGKGGMGVVAAARQTSIDRVVAIKMLRPDIETDEESREKFLGEAIVTGELEHPNIVPIYDLGKDQSGALFYSMKRVKGQPWDTVIQDKSLVENLEILMKVADAVGFAHSRGVVHRDLKPENVMLGDFGEVLVMDWGLAISVEQAAQLASIAGTPAYMPPEMALGIQGKIGPSSDIYLLGAILFQVLTGRPPHSGARVIDCLGSAARNEIAPTKVTGELMEVARKAMAAQPEDRYASVNDLQAAIRDYQSHAQSVQLTERAFRELDLAQADNSYAHFAKALFGFQEAVILWPGNSRAALGVQRASFEYATSAFQRGDFDLAISLLDHQLDDHAGLLQQLSVAKTERASRQRRLQTVKRLAFGLVGLFLVTLTTAFLWIRSERDKAVEARADAVEAATEARAQRNRAESAAVAAEKARGIADEARERAVSAQVAEAEQREQAEREAYMARIGLAAAKIEENSFQRARELLAECPASLRDWEWGRLTHLCQQHRLEVKHEEPIEALAIAPDDQTIASGGWGGTLRLWNRQTGETLREIATGARQIFCVAFSPDGRELIVGTNDAPGYIQSYDPRTGQRLPRVLNGHTDAVLSVTFSADGTHLLTTSYDYSARLWNLATGESQVLRGHDWWVWSGAFSPNGQHIVTASQDGTVLVWDRATGKAQPAFRGHQCPVYSVTYSPDGLRIASGGYDGRVLVWNPDSMKAFDFERLQQPNSPASTTQEKIASTLPPDTRTFRGHTGAVRSLHFTRDGRLLASAGNDNTIRVWNTSDGAALETLRGHGSPVLACNWTSDARQIVSGSQDRRAVVWSIDDYEELRVLRSRTIAGHQDAVLSVDFAPDGQTLVSASRDRTARIWNARSGEAQQVLKEGHDFLIASCRLFPDGKQILTAAIDNSIRIWDVTSGAQRLTLDGTGSRAAVSLSQDGLWILSGGTPEPANHGAETAWSAHLWDASSGKQLMTLSGHTSEITSTAISPDRRLAITGDSSGRCRMWNLATGEPIWQIADHTRSIVWCQFHPDGNHLLTASTDNTVILRDVQTGRATEILFRHPDAVTSADLSRDGQWLVTASADRVARLWSVATGEQVAQWESNGETIHAVALSGDGQTVAILLGNGIAQIWNAQHAEGSQDEVQPVRSIAFNSDEAWSIAFSSDGARLLIAGGDDARLFDIDSGRESMQFTRQGSVSASRFSPGGQQVITGSWDQSAKIWDVASGKVIHKLVGHTRAINDASFSPRGDRAVTASDDGTARVWDPQSGKMVLQLKGHTDRVRSAAFSPDGRRIVTASADRTARIWDATSGQLLQELKGHDQAVLSAAFSHDGQQVVTGGEDNRGLVWDISGVDAKLRASLDGHAASVVAVAFAPSGSRVVTASQDGTAILWDPTPPQTHEGPTQGTEIMTLRGHTQALTAVRFSPDGQSLVTSSQDGTLILWPAADWNSR